MKSSKRFLSPAPMAAFLLSSWIGIPSAPAEVRPASHVVFVHGIFQDGGCFAPLVTILEAQGCECLVPKLTPADAREGLEPLAEQLKRAIDQRWGSTAEVHVVAHSMGGLISRQYLQHLGGHQRCASLTTLATPHHGTLAAWCYPGKGAWQMRAGSEFLQSLAATEHRLAGMALHSYCTPMDLIILPYTSSHWDMAENRTVAAPAHPLVMFCPCVVRHLTEITSPVGQGK